MMNGSAKKQRVVDLYVSGVKPKLICAEMGFSRQWLYHILDEAGIERTALQRSSRLAEACAAEIVEEYAAVQSMESIAADIGVNTKIIRRVLVEQGVDIGPRRSKHPIEEWCRLYESGLSTIEIARRFGVCQTTVHNQVSKRIPMRKRGEATRLAFQRRREALDAERSAR